MGRDPKNTKQNTTQQNNNNTTATTLYQWPPQDFHSTPMTALVVFTGTFTLQAQMEGWVWSKGSW